MKQALIRLLVILVAGAAVPTPGAAQVERGAAQDPADRMADPSPKAAYFSGLLVPENVAMIRQLESEGFRRLAFSPRGGTVVFGKSDEAGHDLVLLGIPPRGERFARDAALTTLPLVRAAVADGGDRVLVLGWRFTRGFMPIGQEEFALYDAAGTLLSQDPGPFATVCATFLPGSASAVMAIIPATDGAGMVVTVGADGRDPQRRTIAGEWSHCHVIGLDPSTGAACFSSRARSVARIQFTRDDGTGPPAVEVPFPVYWFSRVALSDSLLAAANQFEICVVAPHSAQPLARASLPGRAAAELRPGSVRLDRDSGEVKVWTSDGEAVVIAPGR